MPAAPRHVRALVAVATLAVAGSAATGTYTVRRDDTLSGIASRHGVSARSLVAANGITDPNRVVAGRTLTIPGSSGTSAAIAGSGTYTVRRGDTLSHIAARTGTSARSIAASNGLDDADRLTVGRTLRIPAVGGTAAAPSGARASSPSGSYTVRAGDTISGIAARLGVASSALSRANGLSDADRVVVGRVLTVPAGGGGGGGAVAVASAGGPPGLPARLRSSPSRLAYIPVFDRWAAHYGVPADLLKAMTWVESGWQQGAVSSTGAVGIGQIMPDTHRWMRDVVIREPLDVNDPHDNIRMSARYLRWLLDRTGGNVRLSLAGYYQGLAAVQARGLLAETERYVANIVAYRDRHF